MCCNGGEHNHPHVPDTGATRTQAELIHRFGRPVLEAGDVSVDVAPQGSASGVIARLGRRLTAEWLPREVAGANLRLVSLQLLGNDDKDARVTEDRFLARVYDYTHNRTLRVTGSVENPERACVEETATQPLPRMRSSKQRWTC